MVITAVACHHQHLWNNVVLSPLGSELVHMLQLVTGGSLTDDVHQKTLGAKVGPRELFCFLSKQLLLLKYISCILIRVIFHDKQEKRFT